MNYQFVEINENDTSAEAYAPRGGAKELWQSKAHEIVLCGPAETGKTFACLQKLNALLWKYPGANALVVRKVAASMHGSVLQTYRRIVGLDQPNCPIKAWGGEHPDFYQYPNGSRLYICGMDNPQKVLSSERDFIYINQLEELSQDDYETLLTRCTGRGSKLPYTQVLGDCNPGPPTHWILQRDALVKLQSCHEDNPTLFDDQGQITDQGKITLSILDSLTGVRKERLRYGRWVAAEGQVYPDWDSSVHVIDPFDVPDEWPRIWAVDFGLSDPFSWQEWARDEENDRLYLINEIYHTNTLIEDHAAHILGITKNSPRPIALITDHAADSRATLERRLGMYSIPAYKAILEGIQAVSSRLRPRDDGKPGIAIFRNSLVKTDPTLKAAHKPLCLADEFPAYVWKTQKNVMREAPVDKDNHALDAARYAVAYFDLTARGENKVVRIIDARKRKRYSFV